MKGWNSSKHPILTANQMPAPIHWNPMNENSTKPIFGPSLPLGLKQT